MRAQGRLWRRRAEMGSTKKARGMTLLARSSPVCAASHCMFRMVVSSRGSGDNFHSTWLTAAGDCSRRRFHRLSACSS